MKKIKKDDLKISPNVISDTSTPNGSMTKDNVCNTNYACPTKLATGCDSRLRCETNIVDCNTKNQADGCLTKVEEECPTYVAATCNENSEKANCPANTFASACICPTHTEENCQTGGCGTASGGELCCDQTHNGAPECEVQSKVCNSRDYCLESEDCTVFPCPIPSNQSDCCGGIISDPPGCIIIPLTKTTDCQ